VTPLDQAAFRTLMGSFASGVAVVTARDAAGAPAGMTASAVSSVSLEPPLLVVCVDRATDFHRSIEAAPRFALSVLAADQETLSRRFASEAADRFAGVGYTLDQYGLPLLDGVVAHIVCERWDARPAGDHTLFFGLVIGGAGFPRTPLVHFRGGYRWLA
jgi:3-hydroxy-9,10-secoandrosta-1,3,5(10)-triene-9,17-dione monooxygenase reductase component